MTEMVKCQINGRYDIVLPAHRAARPEWYTVEGWERARTDALLARIRSMDYPVVYYVGAEEGDLAALCQMAGASMVLFEPNPKAWPNIRAIWEANNLEVPRCFAGFASNETTVASSTPPLAWLAWAFEEIDAAHGFKELYLEADKYDQIRMDDLVVRRPDIIAMDIEGSEWQALRGAERILREHHPTLFISVHPEFMFHQWNEYSRDLRDWLISLGYDETLLDYQHELHVMYESNVPAGMIIT